VTGVAGWARAGCPVRDVPRAAAAPAPVANNARRRESVIWVFPKVMRGFLS
jgi:hypothetical protein